MTEPREPFSNAEFCRFVAEAREQRARADAAEVEAAELRAALTAESVLIDHDDLIVPICLVCDAIAEHVDEIEHKPDCLLARPAGTRGAALLAAAERLWEELQDAAFGYEGVHWKVQRDAREALDAWRALGAGGTGDTSG